MRATDTAGGPLVSVGSKIVFEVDGRRLTGEILAAGPAGSWRVMTREGAAHIPGADILAVEVSSNAMASADSLAWSFQARRSPPLPGHDKPGPGRPKGHSSCANCPVFALEYRKELLERLARR